MEIRKYFVFRNIMLVSGVALCIGGIISMLEEYRIASPFFVFAWMVTYFYLMLRSSVLIKQEEKDLETEA